MCRENNEVMGMEVEYWGDGGDHGIVVILGDGSRRNDRGFLTKQKAFEICLKFASMKLAGTKFYYEDCNTGTPGYRAVGHSTINFLSTLGKIDEY